METNEFDYSQVPQTPAKRLTPFEIFVKTMKFCWIKFGIRMGLLVFDILTFLLLVVLIGGNFESAMFICICIWLVLIRATDVLLNKYFGYLIKAGHIAVIAKAVTEGVIPDNQIEFGVATVKKRFAVTNVFFVMDRLVNAAVRQLQKIVNFFGKFIAFLPGGKQIVNIINLFISICLGSVDECCLAWVFYNEEQGAFKSSCDGVTIFFQNFKALALRAIKTTAIVVLLIAVVTVVPFIIVVASGNVSAAIIVAFIMFMLSGSVKTCFLDSYIVIAMTTRFMEVAPQTDLSAGVYQKLCKASKKFRQLFEKGQAEQAGAVTM